MSGSFLLADAGAESGNNPNIGYHDLSKSTAAGAYGITDTTWGGLMKSRPDLGLNWANRMDPAANRAAAGGLQDEWTSHLSRSGVPVDNSSLGLASLVGPSAAVALMQADPNAPLGDVLTRAVGPQQAQAMMAANPGLLNPMRTAGGVVQANSQRMMNGAQTAGGMGSVPPSTLPPQVPSAAPQAPMSFQASPPPPMPQNFGTQTVPNAPAPTVNTAGHTGDPLVALGMGMMGGNGWHDAMAKGGEAYAAAQAQGQQNARANAQLQMDTNQLDAQAPDRAAQVAAQRAQAWRLLNPTLSPDTAASLNVQARGQDQQAALGAASNALTQRGQDIGFADAQRGQDVSMQDAQFRAQYMNQMAKGQPQQFVVPAADGSVGRMIEVQNSPAGSTIRDISGGGAPLSALPPGAVPMSSFNQEQQRGFQADKASAKDIGEVMDNAANARNQMDQLQQTLNQANTPGALTGPGMVKSFGRFIDGVTGTSTFGDLSAEQAAQMAAGAGNWNSVRESIHGTGGRLTQQEVGLLQENFPHMATDPAARAAVAAVTQRGLQRQVDVAQQWMDMDPTMQASIKRSMSVPQWEAKATMNWNASHTLPAVAGPAPGASPAPAQASSNPMVSSPPIATPSLSGKTAGGLSYSIQ